MQMKLQEGMGKVRRAQHLVCGILYSGEIREMLVMVVCMTILLLVGRPL